MRGAGLPHSLVSGFSLGSRWPLNSLRRSTQLQRSGLRLRRIDLGRFDLRRLDLADGFALRRFGFRGFDGADAPRTQRHRARARRAPSEAQLPCLRNSHQAKLLMPCTEPRNVASLVLSILKHGVNGTPLSCAHTWVVPTWTVLTGRRACRTGPAPANWIEPVTEPSCWMRPAPRVPSTQVKAKSFPAMNWRACSGFKDSATDGPATALATSAPHTKRESMLLLRLNDLRPGPRLTRCLPYEPRQHWRSFVDKV